MSSLLNIKSGLNSAPAKPNSNDQLILRAPQLKDIRFFNETGIVDSSSRLAQTKPSPSPLKIVTPIINDPAKKSKEKVKAKKSVKFPDDEKIIKDYSEPPKRGWIPGSYSTYDLLDAYSKSCERHKCKPLNRLTLQLKALQDLDCANGEKVNVLNLKSWKDLL